MFPLIVIPTFLGWAEMDNELIAMTLIHQAPELLSYRDIFHEHSHARKQGCGKGQRHLCEHIPFFHAIEISLFHLLVRENVPFCLLVAVFQTKGCQEFNL